ncbi:MAG: FkbM family methyltransferase [Oligoflexia bacterium]|nr:FkbM family methyltransferase [Oligoflexia bacterium]
MRVMNAAGNIFAQNHRLENILASIGHRFPHNKIVRSFCWHTGNQIFLRDPQSIRKAVMQDGFELYVTMSDFTFRHVYFLGIYEPVVSGLIKKLAKPGQIWADVGANIGFYTLLLSKILGEKGKIYAFEPNPKVINLLEKSLLANRVENIVLTKAAVSDGNQKNLTLQIPLHENERASLVHHKDIKEYSEIQVPVLKLDDFVKKNNLRFHGIKIDIEGAEILAFKGMQNIFKDSPPKIIVSEVSHLPDCLMTPVELIKYIEGCGYLSYRIRNEGLHRYKIGESLHPDYDANIAFLLKESVIEFKDLQISTL